MWMADQGLQIQEVVHDRYRETHDDASTSLLSLSLSSPSRCRASGRPDRGDRRIPLFVPEAFCGCVRLRWPRDPAGHPVFDLQHLQRQRPVSLQSAAPARMPFNLLQRLWLWWASSSCVHDSTTVLPFEQWARWWTSDLNANLITVPTFKLWEFAAILMSYVSAVLFPQCVFFFFSNYNQQFFFRHILLFSQGHFWYTLLLHPPRLSFH